jgi:hypothetical protein
METLAFPLLVTVQRNNTGVVSVSMELLRLRLPSNDGLQSNTSQYVYDVRTSQQTPASTACYGDSFTF